MANETLYYFHLIGIVFFIPVIIFIVGMHLHKANKDMVNKAIKFFAKKD